jgi:hypothetical protein
VVPRPREWNRRVRAADDRGRARRDALGPARLPNWPRFAVEDVHRFAGLLTGTFVSLHVLTLFVDSYVPFSLTQLVVPGAAAVAGFVAWRATGGGLRPPAATHANTV